MRSVVIIDVCSELVKLFVNKSVYNKVNVDDWVRHNDTTLQMFGN